MPASTPTGGAGSTRAARTRPAPAPDGSSASRDGWHVVIPNVLPAYISCRPVRSERERGWRPTGPVPKRWARCGAAPRSSAGLAHCGRCGRRMSVRYHTQHGKALPEYVCCPGHDQLRRAEELPAAHSACVDAFVEQQVLAALTPAAVEVSLRAADQVLAERAELERLWRNGWNAPRHDADRARRSHHLAEPENRLVVRQLGERLGGGTGRPAAAQRGRTTASPAAARSLLTPPSGRPSRPGRRHRGPVARGHHHRPPTARRSSARSSTRSSSPCSAPASGCRSPSPGPAGPTRRETSSARSSGWNSSATTRD